MLFSMSGIVSARDASLVNQEKKTYVVLLDAPALYSPDRVSLLSDRYSDTDYRDALIQLQEEIKALIPAASPFSLRQAKTQEVSYSYTDVLNGFTINCDKSTADYIKTIDGVKAVFENFTLQCPEIKDSTENSPLVDTNTEVLQTAQVSAASSGEMMNTQTVYDELGFDGEGRAIAILDTAINVNHDYYKISDGKNVKYEKDDIAQIINNASATNNAFLVSATADTAYRNEKIPYAYNYVTNSSDVTKGPNYHGAHVAGIAAGNSVNVSDGVISGIAPEAQILFFGVFQQSGGAEFIHIAAALEDAVKFDVDAINLSLGIPNASENADIIEATGKSAYNELVEAARNKGITVVFAAGNDNRSSLLTKDIDYGTADNRNYQYSSKVGSVQSEYTYTTYLQDQNGNKYPCIPKGVTNLTENLEVAKCASGSAADINSANVSGKAALIMMPDDIVSEGASVYAARAKSAGAAAVILASSSEDVADGTANFPYPLFVVSHHTGEQMKNAATTLKYVNEKAVIKSTEAPRANKFSSYGYSDNLDITVDFSAPGGNVYSSFGGKSQYVTNSGTSMAAPQIAGATALMYQYVEEKFPEVTGETKVMLVKNLLSSTATTVYDENGAIASVRKTGAGLIQLDKAMSTNIILTAKNSQETKINLGADLTASFDVKFTAHNLSNSPVTFSEVDVELSTDEYKMYTGKGYGFCGLRKLTAEVSGASYVTVPANSSCDVTLTVTLSDSDIAHLNTAMINGFFIDGKVTLKNSSENCDVGIPFSGFYGNWASMPIMTETEFLENFSMRAVSDEAYNFVPPLVTVKENGEIVMPISQNPDEIADSFIAESRLFALANPTRNAYMTIKYNDTVVAENIFINKSFNLGNYLNDILLRDLTEDSTITVELRLPYYKEGNQKQTFTIKLVNDTKYPVISNIYAKNSDGTDYSYITASDNYGISTITAYAIDKDENQYLRDVYMGAKRTGGAKFDLTDLDYIEYIVYDGAFNAIVLVPYINIDVEDGTAYYTNITHEAVSGIPMLATYGENNKMKELVPLASGKISVAAYDAMEFDVSSYKGKNYKLFFWADMDKTLRPICESYSTN